MGKGKKLCRALYPSGKSPAHFQSGQNKGEGNAYGRGSAEKPRGRLPTAPHGNHEGQDRGSNDLPELAPLMINPLIVATWFGLGE